MTRVTEALTAMVWIAVLMSGVTTMADEVSRFEQELFPPPMDRLYEDRIVAESSQWLSVNLYRTGIDHILAADPARFSIVSEDDPAYAARREVRPLSVSSRSRTVRVSIRRPPMLVKHTAVFLELPRPMQPGKHYTVRADGLGSWPALQPVTYDDRRTINDNIRVSQLGYIPGAPKIAYLGQFMGDGGGLPLSAGRFEILNAAGRAVFTGEVVRRNVNEHLVGQEVYELNFTVFEPTTPGERYRLYIPGIGLSHAFEVGADALRPAFTNLMRGHYHQRCGIEISPDFSRHHHAACHLDDAFVDGAVEDLKFVHPKNPPLYPTTYGRHLRATSGHHDAGDYGKYTTTGAGYVFSLLMAMEVFPERMSSDQTGLPTSGNGIPDLLEEVKWELDWLESMQDPDDGGVFGVIKPNTGGYEGDLPLAEAGRYFYPKDTAFTGAYAAALAFASRSPIMRRYFPEDCDRYLAKAKRAWHWLQSNRRFTEYFHYGALFGDWDERCWAALSLYAATGEPEYHDYFLAEFKPEELRWGWWPLTGKIGHTALTYLFVTAQPRDAAMAERCRQVLLDACETYVRDAAQHPYRLSMPQEPIRHGLYGWYFPGDVSGYNLLMGYAVTQDRRYLDTALHNLQYTLGANPFGFSQQTGLGQKRNIDPVDQESRFDGITEPVPGLPLGIGSHGFYHVYEFDDEVVADQHPRDWPLLNRWYDGWNVQTEFTMGPMARETVVAAFFAGPEADPRPAPRVELVADRLLGEGPLTIQFHADVTLPEGARVREVFWDFGDEAFSVQRSPRHRFEGSGREYEVAVTVVDDAGRVAYDVKRLSAFSTATPSASRDDTATGLLHLRF